MMAGRVDFNQMWWSFLWRVNRGCPRIREVFLVGGQGIWLAGVIEEICADLDQI